MSLTSWYAQNLRFDILALPVFLRAQNKEKLALLFTQNLFSERTCPCVSVCLCLTMDDPWCQAVTAAVCVNCYRTVALPIILSAAMANSALQTTDQRNSFCEQVQCWKCFFILSFWCKTLNFVTVYWVVFQVCTDNVSICMPAFWVWRVSENCLCQVQMQISFG